MMVACIIMFDIGISRIITYMSMFFMNCSSFQHISTIFLLTNFPTSHTIKLTPYGDVPVSTGDSGA